MGQIIAVSLIFLLLAAIAYAPFVLICRNVQFGPGLRFLYGLTSAPVFVGLLVINIALVEKFWPAGPQFLKQARPIQDGFQIFPVLFVLCVLAILGSWLWYRMFVWLNWFLDLDEQPKKDGVEPARDVDRSPSSIPRSSS